MFAQIFLWIVGGVLFATIPFESLVKGKVYVQQPSAVAIPNLSSILITQELQSLQSHTTAQGTGIQVRNLEGHSVWYDAQGQLMQAASKQQITLFADHIYQADDPLHSVNWLSESPPKWLGLVDEIGGMSGIWQAQFEDGVRLYFTDVGKFITVRTDYWLWYDALWRLHIMDYSNGEDFNNWLLRIISWLGLIFVLTGLVLSFNAFKRTMKKMQRKNR